MKIKFNKLTTAKKQVEVSFDGKSSTYFDVDLALSSGVPIKKADCEDLDNIEVGGGINKVKPTATDTVKRYFGFETKNMITIDLAKKSLIDGINELPTLESCHSSYLIKISNLSKIDSCAFNMYLNTEGMGQRWIDLSPTNLTGYFDWGGSNLIPNGGKIMGVTVPDGVSIINECAFSGCSNSLRVSLPDSITTINKWAFRLLKIGELNLPSSVTSVDSTAFAYSSIGYLTVESSKATSGLRSIYNQCTPSETEISATKIDDNGFAGVTFNRVILSDTIASIGESAFQGASITGEFQIPSSVKSIGKSAFSGCKMNGTSFLMGNSTIKSIETSTFSGISEGRMSIILPNTLTYIGDTAFASNTAIEDIKIPDSVTFLGESAFNGCTNLSSIKLSSSIADIKNNTFYKCTNLQSLDIPDSVTSIGVTAFYGCSNIPSLVIPDSVTSIGNGFVTGCTSLKSILFGNGTTTLNTGLLSGLTALTNVTLPNTLTAIPDGLFSGCTNLTSITIPDSVTSIGAGAFTSTGITILTLPKSMTTMEAGTFSGFTSLTTLNIPDTITTINGGALYGGTSIATINYAGTEDQWNAITKESGWDTSAVEGYVINYNVSF